VTYRVIIDKTDRPDCCLAGETPGPGEINLIIPHGVTGLQWLCTLVHPLTMWSLDITLTQSVHGILEYITCYWGLYYPPYNAIQSVYGSVTINSYYPSFKAVVTWVYEK